MCYCLYDYYCNGTSGREHDRASMLPLHQMDGSLHRPRAIISWHEQPPPYKMHNFSQRVDHFNFFHSSVFSQRYLVADTHFSQGSPIFVFTGAEGGDIEPLYKFGDYGTPIAFAKSLGALVVFLECRYFGESLPFGNASFDALANRIGLLSIEQILADYQVLIQKIRDEYGWNSPLVTFGGSLAGTLAVLMRVRYPALVDAAWSSSAPLLGYIGTGVSQFAWRAQVTKNYDTLVSGCVSFVRDAFTALQHAPAASVRDAMKTCEDAYSGSWSDVQGAMWGVIESAGEFCYPPSISPIHAYCRALESAGRHDGSGGGRRDVGGGSGNHGGGSSYHSGGRYYDGGGNSMAFNDVSGALQDFELFSTTAQDFQLHHQGIVGDGITRIASIRLRLKHTDASDTLVVKDSAQITALAIEDSSGNVNRTYYNGSLS